MSELVVVDPTSVTTPLTPPPNPFFKPPEEDPRAGFAMDRTTLDEGAVRLEWPDELSSASVKEFQDWLIGRINRARRKAGLGKINVLED